MQVVQEEDIDAAAERAGGGTNIGLHRLRGPSRNGGRVDGDVDEPKRRGLLRSAVLEDLEVVRRQILHERTGSVGDDRVDLDEVDFGPERDLRRSCGAQRRRRGRLASDAGVQKPDQQEQ